MDKGNSKKKQRIDKTVIKKKKTPIKLSEIGYLIIFGGNRKNGDQKKRKKKAFADSGPLNAGK